MPVYFTAYSSKYKLFSVTWELMIFFSLPVLLRVLLTWKIDISTHTSYKLLHQNLTHLYKHTLRVSKQEQDYFLTHTTLCEDQRPRNCNLYQPNLCGLCKSLGSKYVSWYSFALHLRLGCLTKTTPAHS